MPFAPFDLRSRLVPGLSALGGIGSLPPNAVSGLVMYYDASVGGLTVVETRVSAWAGQAPNAVIDQSYIAANLQQWNPARAVIAASGDDWSLTEDSTASNNHNASVTAAFDLAPGTTLVTSVKRGTGSRNVEVWIGSNTRLKVNLADGSIQGSTGSPTYSVTADGTWWRVSITTTTASANTGVYHFITDALGSNSYNGDGSSSIIVKSGITISQAPSAVAAVNLEQSTLNYQPSLAALNGISVPRFDYDAGAANNKFIALAASKNLTNRLHDGTGCTLVLAFANASAASTAYLASTRTNLVGVTAAYTSAGQFRILASNGSTLFDVSAACPTTAVVTYRIAAAGYTVRINGAAVLSGTPASALRLDSQLPFRLGMAQTQPSANHASPGFALYDSVLSDAIVAKLERYWGSRMGIVI